MAKAGVALLVIVAALTLPFTAPHIPFYTLDEGQALYVTFDEEVTMLPEPVGPTRMGYHCRPIHGSPSEGFVADTDTGLLAPQGILELNPAWSPTMKEQAPMHFMRDISYFDPDEEHVDIPRFVEPSKNLFTMDLNEPRIAVNDTSLGPGDHANLTFHYTVEEHGQVRHVWENGTLQNHGLVDVQAQKRQPCD